MITDEEFVKNYSLKQFSLFDRYVLWDYDLVIFEEKEVFS